MGEKISGSYTLEEFRRLKGKTDWDRLAHEGGVAGEDGNDSQADRSAARLAIPQPKKAVSLRIDADVLAFFRSQGKGYQTRMNAVLRAYMEVKKAG